VSATDSMEAGVLDLYFLNIDHPNIGDAAGLPGSATAGSLFVSLHTADPGETGDQTTGETTYVGYARAAVARSGSGWVRTGSTVNPAAAIAFPACTGGTATISHFGIGTAASGTGTLLFKGPVTPQISVSAGVTPRLTTGTSISAD
jgi:hypothetical protein